MSRKQHRYRLAGNRDHRQRDQPASKAGDRGGVQRGAACPDGLSPFPLSGARQRYLVLAVCGLLVLAVGLVFGQTVRHEFVNLDDTMYVYENPQVSRGLTAEGICWAFTDTSGNWHPLTWLSLMGDCQFYGLNAGGHHLTNNLLHAATAVLLFLVLWRMTGGFWPSALVAALFAVHPLHVESVAWVTERKDVLSGLFFVLTLAVYVHYVRRRFSWGRYLLLSIVFALGLMAKQSLVTLPFVLLLLDYWPLRRWSDRPYLKLTPPLTPPLTSPLTPELTPPHYNGGDFVGGANFLGSLLGRFSLRWQLVLEKLPLLLLAAVASLDAVWAASNVLAPTKRLPWGWRIGNAVILYVAYLGQFFYPLGLAAFYPRPGLDLPMWRIGGAFLILLSVTVTVCFWRRRCPYLLVGWLWYLGILVPMIGLVQVGIGAMADRFTYLPQIGLCIAVVWGLTNICRSSRRHRWVCGVTSALVLLVLMGCAWRQTSFWRDSETLWTHVLACTSGNNLAHNSLGAALAGRGEVDEAIQHYRQALEINPRFAEAHANLGVALAGRGEVDEAIQHYRQALEINPRFAEPQYNLGNALAGLRRIDEAVTHYRKALEINPCYAEAHNNLGVVLAGRGEVDEAIQHYRQALEINPYYAEAHNNLGGVLAGRGEVDEAIQHYRQALEIKPYDAEPQYNLGNALAGLRRIDEAVTHYRKALEINPRHAGTHNNLGIVLAGRGEVDEAIQHYRQALEINPHYAEAHKNLAWLLATCPAAALRNGAEAIEHAQRANRLSGGRRPDVLHTLAAAYAEAGQFPEALAAVCKGMELATQQNNRALADALHTGIALYEAGKPYHQTPAASTPPPKP